MSLLTSEWQICGDKEMANPHQQGSNSIHIYDVKDMFETVSTKICSMVFVFPDEEKMLLQGVGLEEYSKYGMDMLTPSQLSNMVGNALLV